MDIDDLKVAIDRDRSIEDVAEFFCRSGTVDEVEQKCEELGLNAALPPKRKLK